MSVAKSCSRKSFLRRRARAAILVLLLTILFFSTAAAASSYQYIRLGEKADSAAIPVAGTAMMGGGDDLDEAFRWLCRKANGGDFLVLRARGDDDYNPYVNGLCKLNSVATLIIPDRNAAQDPAVADIIRHAEAVFIAGGDQSRYVNFWQGTPVQDAINANIASGKPIGGTSAGLAVLGEFAYGCLKDKDDDNDLASTDVLPNPYHERVTLVRDFLKVPNLGKHAHRQPLRQTRPHGTDTGVSVAPGAGRMVKGAARSCDR